MLYDNGRNPILHEFAIDQTYDLALRNKMDQFRRKTGTKKALQLTMITTYGLKNGKYNSLVGRQVVLDDLFVRCDQ